MSSGGGCQLDERAGACVCVSALEREREREREKERGGGVSQLLRHKAPHIHVSTGQVLEHIRKE